MEEKLGISKMTLPLENMGQRMEDRRFTEVDLRTMLSRSTAVRADVAPGRWVAATRFRKADWEIIVEPDEGGRILVVIAAYPT